MYSTVIFCCSKFNSTAKITARSLPQQKDLGNHLSWFYPLKKRTELLFNNSFKCIPWKEVKSDLNSVFAVQLQCSDSRGRSFPAVKEQTRHGSDFSPGMWSFCQNFRFSFFSSFFIIQEEKKVNASLARLRRSLAFAALFFGAFFFLL